MNLREFLGSYGLQVRWGKAVDTLPTFRMHKAILPKARLKAGLMVFHAMRP
jgi:hypothetical protein